MVNLDISKLRTVSELKGRIKDVFSDEQLEELARNYGCPHYVLSNPITGRSHIYFIPSEINEWYVGQFVQANACRIEQKLQFLHFGHDDHKTGSFDIVPTELSRIKLLYKLPIEILSTPPGIYFLCKGNEIVYVGQARNVARRITEHLRDGVKDFNQVYFIPCLVAHLMEFEIALIRRFRPKYNSPLGPCNEKENSLYEHLCEQAEQLITT